MAASAGTKMAPAARAVGTPTFRTAASNPGNILPYSANRPRSVARTGCGACGARSDGAKTAGRVMRSAANR